jgi:aryl-alcohol dehydrogenase-like predicted oxidoreductase
LKRLETNYLDLYQIHFHDADTPVEETVGALEDLRSTGKIRYYGLGHLPPDRMAEYMAAGQIFSALTELSAVARGALERQLPLCRDQGVGVIAFSVTGRGLLTGKIGPSHIFEEGDIRRIDPLFQRERLASGRRILAEFEKLGAKYDKTPVQVAIAWVLAQPQVACALTGPSTLHHLEENIGGSGWTLEAKDLMTLERFFAAEDEWVCQAQILSLHTILTGGLEPENAFADLVYTLETLVQMGVALEGEIMPLYGQLMPLRKRPGAEVVVELQAIRARLRERFLPLLVTESL